MGSSGLRGILWLNLAVALFGMSGVASSWLDMPSWFVAASRCLISSACLFPALKILKIPSLGGRDHLLAAAGGGVLALHWWSFFQSIRVSSVAVGTFAFASFPLFTMGLEALLRIQRPSLRDLALGGGILAGIGVMTMSRGLGGLSLSGVLWGLVSSATFAGLAVLNSRLVRANNPFSVALVQQWWAFVFLSPGFLTQPMPAVTLPKVLGLVSMGILFTALAHGLFIASMRTVSPSRAALVSGLEPVYATGLAMVLLGQMPSLGEAIGGAMVLVFAAMATAPESNKGQ
ncbi:putative permease, DMT superfamily [Thermanaerovibrio velox DSM 12556]|uniref:Putative permease, DMT superfamily n=1 Tax=Thermanaerovibrio velox DSM 12556 TaxID=926567 RepID=H0UN18_9BACT|nr:DMT family transporter [Thermanaerovibrio velox]EHM09297.1 putative permease, DMT superfamily [Thermanaerovibrio velox DSM 12556]